MNIVKQRLIKSDVVPMDLSKMATKIWMKVKTEFKNSEEYKDFAFGLTDSIDAGADKYLKGYYSFVKETFEDVINQVTNGDKPEFSELPVNEIVRECADELNFFFQVTLSEKVNNTLYQDIKKLDENEQKKVVELVAESVKKTDFVTESSLGSKLTKYLKNVFNQIVKAGPDGAQQKYDDLCMESDAVEL